MKMKTGEGIRRIRLLFSRRLVNSYFEADNVDVLVHFTHKKEQIGIMEKKTSHVPEKKSLVRPSC